MASPFVQGQLRKQRLRVIIESECACCARPLRIETDGGDFHQVEEGARPLAFFPPVDFRRWPDPSIIDGF